MEAKTLALYLGCETNLGTLITVKLDEAITSSKLGGYVKVTDFSQLKLLLRPLSSMTEEEAIEHQRLSRFNQREDWAFIKSQAKAINYLRSVCIDCDGLIDSGQAIDSTKKL